MVCTNHRFPNTSGSECPHNACVYGRHCIILFAGNYPDDRLCTVASILLYIFLNTFVPVFTPELHS